MMQMRHEVIGGHRESSAGLGKGRRRIKEGHLSCYYTIVKRELICVNEEVKSDMWQRKKGPLRRAQAQSTTHAQYQK